MNKYSLTVVAAVLVLIGISGSARAQQSWPSCQQWQQQKLDAQACLCGREIRRGDARLNQCPGHPSRSDEASASRPAAPQGLTAKVDVGAVSAASFDGSAAPSAAVLPDAPQPQAQKERKFGLKSVTVEGGYITGADGSGAKNGSVAVEFYRQKTKAGTLSAEAEIGRYRMDGIAINNTQNVGVVGQLPNGMPINGTAVTTGVSPAVSYIPLADFKYAPPMPHQLDRLHPYAVGEIGLSRLASTNALVNTQVVSTLGGQTVGVQNLGSSLQSTGQGINHPGGGFGGGATFDLTKSGRFAIDGRFIDAPTGYKVAQGGLKIRLGKLKSAKRKTTQPQ